MPNIYNLKDKIYEMFGNSINKNVLSLYIDTIGLEFSYDFPQMKSLYINNNSGGNLVKLNINDIDNNFMSVIGYISGKGLYNIEKTYNIYQDEYTTLSEKMTMDIYSKFLLFNMSSSNLIQPIIDSTNVQDASTLSFITLNIINIPSRHIPALLFYNSKRDMNNILLNGLEIDHHIYSIFEDYVVFKVIDYLFLENVEQLTDKITDLWNKNYSLINKLLEDTSGVDPNQNQFISSINLGGVSISYDNNSKVNSIGESASILDKILSSTKDLMNSYKEFYFKLRNDRYKNFISKKKSQLFGMSSVII